MSDKTISEQKFIEICGSVTADCRKICQHSSNLDECKESLWFAILKGVYEHFNGNEYINVASHLTEQNASKVEHYKANLTHLMEGKTEQYFNHQGIAERYVIEALRQREADDKL